MDEADRQEPTEVPARPDVAAAIAALRERRETLQQQAQMPARGGLRQRVIGEPQAKLMRTPHGSHAPAGQRRNKAMSSPADGKEFSHGLFRGVMT